MVSRDEPFRIDTREDWAYVLGTAVLVALLFAQFTALDSQVRFAVTQPSEYFSVAGDSEPVNAVTFTRGDVDFLNRANKYSLNDGFADERLYCFSLGSGDVVQNLRLADSFDSSSRTSVSGACFAVFGQGVDGFIHTQPGGNNQLSPEDRDVESSIAASCIHYDEIVVSPVSGEVGGLDCWRVTGVGTDAVFESVPVKVEG